MPNLLLVAIAGALSANIMSPGAVMLSPTSVFCKPGEECVIFNPQTGRCHACAPIVRPGFSPQRVPMDVARLDD